MSLIIANKLSFSYEDEYLFKNINFSIETKDKVGLIGANGAGKSTLFKLMTGELPPTDGFLSIGKDCVISYMEQHACAGSKKTVYDELLTVFEPLFEIQRELDSLRDKLDENSPDFEKNIERQHFLNVEYERLGGLTYLSRARSTLIGMGFSEDYFGKPVETLSGGEKSKLSLCKLLLSGADVLLLDEPTNHLDIKSIEWLEAWLSDFKGTFIVISHDRYFLDKVTNKTLELHNNTLYSANHNYSGYIMLKSEREKAEQREYEASMKEVKRIEGIIEQQKRFNRERNYITIASKQKSIDRILKDLKQPDKELSSINFSFETDLVSGNDVLLVNNLSKSFGNLLLFENVELDLKRGEKCFIVGDNGCGKSTLLKIILNKTSRDSGKIILGTGIKIGYFDQSLAELSTQKTIIDEVWDSYRQMTETEVRSALALFLFKGDDVYKSMSSLSGGEKARVSILKLMLSKANFLILDEPTNNLDIASRQVLEDALQQYNGTLLIVSHDRYFINNLATKIVALTKTGLLFHEGNYESYLTSPLANRSFTKPKVEKSTTNTYRAKKEHESNIRKLEGKISRLENEINDLDASIECIQKKIDDPDNSRDYQKILEITEELDKMSSLQLQKIELWEQLNEELEDIKEGNTDG